MDCEISDRWICPDGINHCAGTGSGHDGVCLSPCKHKNNTLDAFFVYFVFYGANRKIERERERKRARESEVC